MPPRRLIVAFDASGSMAGTIGHVTKMDAARQAVNALLDGIPEDVALGLVAFGHKGNNEASGRGESCAGVETLAAANPDNRQTIRRQMDELDPTGWTPLAAALESAAAELSTSETPGEQIVYVVSDGEETCDGDPIAVARKLRDGNTRAIVNVLGLDLPAADRAQLETVASAGGGLFTAVETESELAGRIAELRRSNVNAGEMLRTRNQAALTQLRNDNKVSGALLRLDNCVGIRALREDNRVRKWARDEQLSPEAENALRTELTALHETYRTRAAAIRASAEDRLDEANSSVQERMDATERDYEAVR